MSPRVYEWIRLRALVAARNFEELEEGATMTKKSTIGWEAYFTEILAAGNPKLAGSIFVAKCTGLTVRERGDMWMRCGMLQAASEELFKAKDLAGLEDLKTRSGSSSNVELERMIAALRVKR